MPNLYSRRVRKEADVSKEDVRARIRWELPVLAKNQKCSVSLDLPLLNCKPTKACAEVCYASQGRQNYRGAIVKSLAINRMIADDPERVARKMVDEAAGRPIRLAGSGELLPGHKTLLDYVEHYGGSYWGFTRRVDTHQAIPKLMFSLDATSPASVLGYARNEVPARRRAYLRRPDDPPSPLEVAVTFPVHGPQTSYLHRVPSDPTDCPAIRHATDGCWDCRRCY